MSRFVGYARVSTNEQTLTQQVDALRSAGCVAIFEDVFSGVSVSRTGLQNCLESLSSGDTLLVVRLDRLGRSMSHLVSTVQELANRGIGFRSLEECIDTGSATGRLVLHLFAALAAFERDLIAERTRAALQAKRSRGESLGRRRSLTTAQIQEAETMISDGKATAYVARLFRVDRVTLYRALRRPAAG